MKSNIELEKLYLSSNDKLTKLITSEKFIEKDLINIISDLYLDKEFTIFEKNNYNLDSISNLFRFYEEELTTTFNDDKIKFHLLFKIYLLILELFTYLCTFFATNKEKRILIDKFFQILKESKSMLKFFIPFEEKELKVLNNIIGEQLYYFTHIQYIHIKDKSLDYIFEEYFLNCEKMFHGFELSLLSDFGENKYKNKDTEEMIFLNNLSFLLLKMIHKLNCYYKNVEYFENKKFQEILKFFIDKSKIKKRNLIKSKKDFEDMLIKEFIFSSNFLRDKKNYDMYDEKLKLLALNTDEYKELIDIILTSKEFDLNRN